ncbi:hypothetical protein GF325_14950 [Candidatus Bathyarchaeota archaeon]|nr:hypothetical protein [Candidatus Bathyarchaeota archaeon]
MTSDSDRILFGILSVILGIISIAVFDFYAIIALIAIVLGAMALQGDEVGKVFGFVGLILGIVSAVVILSQYV